MKIMKSVSFAILALAVASFSSACGWFQDDSEEPISSFYSPDDASGEEGMAGEGAENAFDVNAHNGEEGMGGEGQGANGPWGQNPAIGADGQPYTDGFGPRIPGVEFEAVYFLFDQNNIPKTEEFKVLQVADFLKSHPEAGVVIEGNCDERGTTEYNRVLGEKRAISAKTILLEQGIAENRMKTVSYGEERPAVQGTDETAFEKNRRDDFVPVRLLK